MAPMPADQPESVTAQAYLTIEPQWSSQRDDKGRRILRGATIASITKTPPDRSNRHGTIVTKVKFEVPARLMLPLGVTDIEIALTEADVESIEPIQVEVEGPGYPDDAAEDHQP